MFQEGFTGVSWVFEGTLRKLQECLLSALKFLNRKLKSISKDLPGSFRGVSRNLEDDARKF